MSNQDPWSRKTITAGLFIQIVGGVVAGMLTIAILSYIGDSNTSTTSTEIPQSSPIIKYLENEWDNSVAFFQTAPGFLIAYGTLVLWFGIIFFRKDKSSLAIFLHIANIAIWIGLAWLIVYYLLYGKSPHQ